MLWVESLGHHFGHVFGRMDSRSFMIVQKKIISSFAGYLWFSVTKNSRIELWNGQSCLVLKIHFGVWWFWTLVSDRKKWIYSINFWMISFARRCFSKKNDSVLQACACQQILELLEIVYAVQTLELYQQTTFFTSKPWGCYPQNMRDLDDKIMGSHWTSKKKLA